MFSAIAMIAFVGSSMANDIALREVETANLKEISNEKVEQVEAEINCNLARFGAYVDAISAGLSSQDASSASWAIYFECKLFNHITQAPQ